MSSPWIFFVPEKLHILGLAKLTLKLHQMLTAKVYSVPSARILVPVKFNDMNPMAIADSGASHVILPQTALNDDKSAKPVNCG